MTGKAITSRFSWGSVLWWRRGTHREMYVKNKPVCRAQTASARGNEMSTVV